MYYALNEANKDTLDKVFAMAAGVANAATGAIKIKDDSKTKSYSYSSIAKAASALVAVFPILTSRTVSAETAQAVSKFIEQKACTLITLGLQQANISSNAKTGIDYLKQFHQNLDVGGSGIDTVAKTMQAWIDAYNTGKAYAESSISLEMCNNMESDMKCDSILEADDIEISSTDLKNIMETMATLDNIQVYDTQLNPMSINDYIIKETVDGNYHVSIKNYEPLHEAQSEYEKILKFRQKASIDDRIAALPAKYQEYIFTELEEREREYKKTHPGLAYTINIKDNDKLELVKKYEDEYDRFVYGDAIEKSHRNDISWQQSQEDREAQKKREEDERLARNASGRNISALRDQDIKKMNDAVPSLLVVKFYQSDTASVATEFIIGVKSKMIPVTTTEVLRRIMNDNKDGKKFINFMRMITGELKASEFFLGISRVKEDIKSCRVKGAYGDTWNLLKNRADAAREQIKHGRQNDYSAITTVLISQADAEELFREENFDITDPKNALHFMESYNLMAFGIADDATECLKILFDDNSKMFEEISYTMLERESKDGTYKKLINLMAASR